MSAGSYVARLGFNQIDFYSYSNLNKYSVSKQRSACSDAASGSHDYSLCHASLV